MATIKIILRKKHNEDGSVNYNTDGTLPITMRITKDRKTSFIYLGYSVHENMWDQTAQRVKKSHLNHARLNNFIIKKLSEANDTSLEMETNKADVTVRSVRNKIKPAAGATFSAQGEEYLKRLRAAGKYNQYTPEKSRIKHFNDFAARDISFSDITPALLERFKAYVRAQLQLGERSAVNHLVTIRSVFSQAIRDNIVDAKHYPFGKGKVKIKFPDSIKIGLTPEEVKALEAVILPDPLENHVRNLWLISFYFAGMRISDVLRMKWRDIQDNRLHYTMGKNSKGGSLKVPEKALKIIDQYKADRRRQEDLIFPELKLCDFENKFATQRTIGFKTSAIDKCLKKYVAPAAGIEKALTMHIARHTFGNISGDRIPIQMLQKLYRHSSITTTIGYQANFIHKDADDALNLVINEEAKKLKRSE